MQKALVIGGNVEQLDLTGAPLTGEQVAAGWRIVGDDVAPGMVEQPDSSFATPVLSPTGAYVNAERNRRILAGRDFAVIGHVPQIAVAGDATTQNNLSNLAQAAMIRTGQGDVTHITNYRDENNVIHALTPPQIIELWSLGAAYVSEVYASSWALKDDPAGIPASFAEDVHWP